MTVVMVESDAGVLARMADRVAIMDGGCIIAVDTPGALYADPRPLIERGVPVPEMASVAIGLNQQLGTQFHFIDRDGASSTLRDRLRAVSAG